jgi:hypothetical protein
MGLGLGVVLLIAGLILVADVINVGTAFVDEGTLGWILIGAGALTIVLALVMNAQRSRTHRTVEERRYDDRR